MKCDCCGSVLVEGHCFECLVCSSYKLCEKCFDLDGPFTGGHLKSHPMNALDFKGSDDEIEEEPRPSPVTSPVSGDSKVSRNLYMMNLAMTQEESGEIELNRGNCREAAAYLENALSSFKSLGASGIHEYIRCIGISVTAYSGNKNFEKALSLSQEKYDLLKENFPENKESLHETMEGIIALLTKLGQYEDAVSFCKDDLEVVSAAYGRVSSQYADALHTLAFLQKELFLYDEAIANFEETLKIRTNVTGTSQPDYSICLNNLAVLHFGRKEYDESEKLYLEACERMKSSIGENHPSYITFLYNIASLYHIVGKETLRDNFLRKAVQLSPDDDPDVEGGNMDEYSPMGEPKAYFRRRSSVFMSSDYRAVSAKMKQQLKVAIAGGSGEIYEILLNDDKRREREHLDAAEKLKKKSLDIFHEERLESLETKLERRNVSFNVYIPKNHKQALMWILPKISKKFLKVISDLTGDMLLKHMFYDLFDAIQFIICPFLIEVEIDIVYPNEYTGDDSQIIYFRTESEKMKLEGRYGHKQRLLNIIINIENYRIRNLHMDFVPLAKELIENVLIKGTELSLEYTEKLPRCNDKLGRTVNELISTEHHYICRLEQLVEGYVHPLREMASKKGSFISSEQIGILFNNIEFILRCNKELLQKLKGRCVGIRNLNQIQLNEAFESCFDMMKKTYSWYNSQYSKALLMIKELELRREFVEFCATRRRFLNLNLESFLILPVQRLARYELLLRDIIKLSGETSIELEGTLTKLSALNDEINKNIRMKENQIKLIEIGSKIDMGHLNSLIAPHRLVLIADFKEVYVSSPFESRNVPMIVILFNDVMVLAVPAARGKHQLVRSLSLAKLKITKVGEIHPECSFNVFATHPVDKFVRTAEQAMEKEKERVALSNASKIREFSKSDLKLGADPME